MLCLNKHREGEDLGTEGEGRDFRDLNFFHDITKEWKGKSKDNVYNGSISIGTMEQYQQDNHIVDSSLSTLSMKTATSKCNEFWLRSWCGC